MLQNRVTPFGDIVAIAQRGMFTGNRGIIHDPSTKTLLKRRWTSRAWLVCECEYKANRRIVMDGRSWTELFFLDEAVALAAGHRPCFFCRRSAAKAFCAAWAKAKNAAIPTAPQVDAVLHSERLADGKKRIHAINRAIGDLPDGAVVVSEGTAFVVAAAQTFPWTERGYGPAQAISHAHAMLTPPSSLAALEHGYRPMLHPTLAGRTHPL